jgi:hypothetical protein
VTIYELDRNDVEGAMAVYRGLKARGKWRPEDGSMLLMLQDDPEELLKRMLQDDEPAGTEVE